MKKIKYITFLSACLLTSIKAWGMGTDVLDIPSSNPTSSQTVSHADPERIFEGYKEALWAYGDMWEKIQGAVSDVASIPGSLKYKKENPNYSLSFSHYYERPLLPFLVDPYAYFEQLRGSLHAALNQVELQDRQQMWDVYAKSIPFVETELISLVGPIRPLLEFYELYRDRAEDNVQNVTETDEELANLIKLYENFSTSINTLSKNVRIRWNRSTSTEPLKQRIADTALVKAMNEKVRAMDEKNTKNETITLPPADFHLSLTSEDQIFLQEMQQLKASLDGTQASGWSNNETIMKYVHLLGREVQTSHYENFEKLFELLKRKLESKQVGTEKESVESVIIWLTTDSPEDSSQLIQYMNARPFGVHVKFMDTLRMLKKAYELLAPQQKENFQILRIIAAYRLRDQRGHCETGARIRSFLTIQELLEFLK